ncbi:hypothetical protein Hanom_Chr10g00929531 [Helianthus anomalus]
MFSFLRIELLVLRWCSEFIVVHMEMLGLWSRFISVCQAVKLSNQTRGRIEIVGVRRTPSD